MGCLLSTSTPYKTSTTTNTESTTTNTESTTFQKSITKAENNKGVIVAPIELFIPVERDSASYNSSSESASQNLLSQKSRKNSQISNKSSNEEGLQKFFVKNNSKEEDIISIASNMNSEMSCFSEDAMNFENLPLLNGFSIDTSRARSNAHVVSMCAKKLSMIEYNEVRDDALPCHIYWHNVVYGDMKNVVTTADARVNKFPGMTELAKKIALTQAIRSMKELYPEEYQFYPNSWVLPAQLDDFRAYCSKYNKSYIVKPDDGAQGSGIYLIGSAEELLNTESRQLIQEYVAEPYLLKDSLKFDFRVYAVIKSINPLSIYVAREGMARFCTEKYLNPTPENFGNLYAHLTNYSLNKANNTYVHSRSLKEQLQGSKRLLSTVLHQMQAQGVRTRKLWHEIKLIIIKTVLAMVPEIMLNYEHYFAELPGPQCFQIMGFDIIVQNDSTPFLLEVNSAPSLSVQHQQDFIRTTREGIEIETFSSPSVRSIVDEMIKVPLVRDSLLLVLDKLGNQSTSARDFESPLKIQETNTINEKDTIISSNRKASLKSTHTLDDIAILKTKKKPHLSEIFPGRYGRNSKHLLVLDRAVYLFMQFVNIKQSIHISLPAIKALLRKCNLMDVLSGHELEQKFAHINYYFTGQAANYKSELPFHGFLQFLFYVARLKFEFCEDLLAALLRLLAYCDSTLRYYGVRSTRLRRAEIEPQQTNENQQDLVEIYLLPSRMRRPLNTINSTTISTNNSQQRSVVGIGKRRLPTTTTTTNNQKTKNKTQRSRSLPRRV